RLRCFSSFRCAWPFRSPWHTFSTVWSNGISSRRASRRTKNRPTHLCPWLLRLLDERFSIPFARPKPANQNSTEKQPHQRHRQIENADRIRRRCHGSNNPNYEYRQAPVLQISADGEYADPFQKQHHDRQLKRKAESQRQKQHEAEPFADPRLGVDSHRTVETEEKTQNRFEYKARHEHAEQKQSNRKLQRNVYKLPLVRIQPRGHEHPHLIKHPRARQHQARNQRSFEPDHKRFLAAQAACVSAWI